MIARWSALDLAISTLAWMLPTQGGASIRWGRRDQTSCTPRSTNSTRRRPIPRANLRGVRLRTDAAKRLRRQENALCHVWKIVERLSRHWQALNGGRNLRNLMMLVLEGCVFEDRVLQPRAAPRSAAIDGSSESTSSAGRGLPQHLA